MLEFHLILARKILPIMSTGAQREDQPLLEELRAVPGYLGVLEYGSRARGDDHVDSDYDLIVVTSSPTGIARLHMQNIDLNFLTYDELRAILLRLKQRQQLPWDTMLTDVNVVDDKTGQLASLAIDIAASIRSQPVDADAIAGLRFLIWHFLKNVAKADDVTSLEAGLRLSSTISAIAVAYEIIIGQPWQGLDIAIQNIRADAPSVYGKLNKAIDGSLEWAERVNLLNSAALEILKDHGGLWDGKELELSSWIENQAERPSRQISDELWDKIRNAARQLGS